MTARAFTRAERCFALARSTSFAGERSSAVARGTAIAEQAGLSLDLFDIPGRVREAPRIVRSRAPESYEHQDVRDITAAFRAHMNGVAGAMESFYATMDRRAAETGAADGETVYDARRRNFDAAAAQARVRDEARG